MKKYKVTFCETRYYKVEVDAKDRDSAINKAEKILIKEKNPNKYLSDESCYDYESIERIDDEEDGD